MVRASETVRTLSEALEAGFGNAAVWLATAHPGLREQYDQIRRWFPNMRHQSINAALRYVRDTVFAGQRANDPEARQLESIVPENPNIERRGTLRYYLRVTLSSTDQSQGHEAGGLERTGYIQLNLRRMRNADEIRRELRRRILDTLRSQHERYYIRDGMPRDLETYNLGVEVLGIQRR